MTEPTILDRIFAELDRRGLKSRPVCVAAGLAPNVLSMARTRGGNSISAETVAAVARVLEVPVGQLIGEAAAIPSADPSRRLVPLDQIFPSPDNPRKSFDAEDLRSLADSIAATGLLQNLVVREIAPAPEGKTYQICAGERRWRALCLLAQENRLPAAIASGGVPVMIMAGGADDQLAVAIIENLKRQDVNPVEEADGFAALQAMNPARWTNAAIAAEIGMSTRHVQQRLALASKLSPVSRERLRAGAITLGAARALTAIPADRQAEILEDSGADPSAETIRLSASRVLKLVPVSRAIFETALYDGPIVEDEETGQRYFADRARFLELQRAAVARRVADLRALKPAPHRNFVDEASWYDKSKYGAGRDATRTGILVEFDAATGIVKFHEKQLRLGGGFKAALEAMRATLVAERTAAQKQLRQDIAAQLDFGVALRLLVLHHMTAPGDVWPLAECRTPPALYARGAPLDPFAGVTETRWAASQRVLGAGADISLVWSRLVGLPPDSCDAAVTQIVAGRLADGWQFHPVLLELAWEYGVAVPASVTWTDADLEIHAAARLAAEAVEEAA